MVDLTTGGAHRLVQYINRTLHYANATLRTSYGRYRTVRIMGEHQTFRYQVKYVKICLVAKWALIFHAPVVLLFAN